MITTSSPAEPAQGDLRNASRISLFARFRATAVPMRRLTDRPRRADVPPARALTTIVHKRPFRREPSRKTPAKALLPLSRRRPVLTTRYTTRPVADDPWRDAASTPAGHPSFSFAP
jgi:hypothetical protein